MDGLISTNLRYDSYESTKAEEYQFHEIRSDPTALVHSSSSLLRPVDPRLSDKIKNDLVENSLLFVSIILHSSNFETIGFLFLKSASPDMAYHRFSELGIDMANEYHTEGYDAEAVNWALDWAFREAGLHRVECKVPGWDSDAQEMYQEAGFQKEGQRRQCFFKGDKWWDEVHLGILKEEWQHLRSQGNSRDLF